MATKIFISYRRENGGVYARLLRELLEKKGYKVFLDTEGLGPGHFDEQLLNQIEKCDYFISLLTEGALSRPFVRREIEHAFRCKKIIIPIIDYKFLYPNNLPEPFSALQTHQSINTNIADITQVNYVVQQLDKYIKPSSPPLLKYFGIGFAALALVFAAFSLPSSKTTNGNTPQPETQQSAPKSQTPQNEQEEIPATPPKGGSYDSNPEPSTRGDTHTEKTPPPSSSPPSPSEVIRQSNSKFEANGKTIIGSNNQITGSNNQITGSNNEITGSNNKIKGSNNEIYGDYNTVHGSNNETHGTGNTSVGSNNENYSS